MHFYTFYSYQSFSGSSFVLTTQSLIHQYTAAPDMEKSGIWGTWRTFALVTRLSIFHKNVHNAGHEQHDYEQ